MPTSFCLVPRTWPLESVPRLQAGLATYAPDKTLRHARLKVEDKALEEAGLYRPVKNEWR